MNKLLVYSLSFIFSCIVNLCINTVVAQKKVLPKPNIPALFAFGDSLVDSGNNNNLPFTLIKANFAPYGRNFKDDNATGRFSNGRLASDFLAEALGIKKYLPAYTDSGLKDKDLLTGVSFASAGTGFDPLTARLFFVNTMKKQLKMFRMYITKVKDMVGENQTNIIIHNSAYIVVCGNDDLTLTYFGSPFTRNNYTTETYTDLMRNAASAFLKKLYKLGARKIFVSNLAPLGCLPSQRTLGGGQKRECAKKMENATLSFNKKLASEIESLGKTLDGSNIVLWDLHSIMLDLINNSSKYGFVVVDKGCCGSGLIELAVFCNPYTPTCKHVSKFIFWDSFHPTEKASQLVIQHILKKYNHHFF